ncbi:hypothetical protein [Catelliglobosispora koreensis]|uniref:hypothetical protein n=1 Tax=Catelliglobosispora koreensis TaxID=129052 RepID=UPI00036A1F28|nr:hypothetical protein [Catelliglobosispora koreensis]
MSDYAAALRELIGLIGEVPTATSRFGIRDDLGKTMDTLKVISSPAGGYLAVYHVGTGHGYEVHLATSADLLNWTHQALLDEPASQPTIAVTPDGGFLVVVEAGGDGRPAWLRFLYYPNVARLLSGDAVKVFDAPHTITHREMAEGTPNVYQVTFAPDIEHSTVITGFHYLRATRFLRRGDVDRQAQGLLVNFQHWTTRRERHLDAALARWNVKGNIGGRDEFRWRGRQYTLIEGQLGKHRWESWRIFLYDPAVDKAYPVAIKTPGGSAAFANPTVTMLTAPSGAPALLVTLYLFDAGAASGEEGPLLYYHELTDSGR